MKKLVKTVLAVVIVLIVLMAVGVIGVALFADRAVKAAVESAGARTLNVGVDVEQADVSLLGGALVLRGIAVANPPGYEGAALLTLQRVDVKADTGSLLAEEVVIEDMKLDHMEVFVEQKGLQNNLYEVIKPLREPRPPTGKRLIIDRLAITNVAVHVSLPPIPGQAQTMDFTLDPITMTGLGRDERMDMPILIGKIVLAVTAGVAEKTGDILPAETIRDMTGILDKAIDIGRIILGPGKSGEPNQPKGDDLGKTVTEGLKDLLGGKKEQ